MLLLDQHKGHQLFMWLCGINLGVAILYGFAAPITAYTQGDQSPLYTLITTHVSHHSPRHLTGNLMALWLLMLLFPVKTSKLIGAFIGCVFIIAGYVNLTGINAFMGFSALLYCIPGCYLQQSQANKTHHISIGILLILYTYLFMIVPSTTIIDDQWQPMTAAHLMGFISGYLTAILYAWMTDKIFQDQPLKGT